MDAVKDAALDVNAITFHREVFVRYDPTINASVFCSLMHHRDAPRSFVTNIVEQLQRWRLISPDLDMTKLTTPEEVLDIMLQAKAKAKLGEVKFLSAFQAEPWQFDRSYEGEYTEDELDKFPRADELRQQLGKIKFVFRAQPGGDYLKLIVREDGRRQVLHEVSTQRTIEQINDDGRNTPAVVPRFEAVKFGDGKIGLLIDWIDGQIPSTRDEKLSCLAQAEGLLDVAVDEYDLWGGNFRITSDNKPFYVDKDIPEAIAKHGYSSETAEARRPIFETNKMKMNLN